MIVRCGTVTGRDGERCRVEIAAERCPGCSGHCAVGLGFVGLLNVSAPADVETGDRVRVGVDRRGFSLAAAALFGWPVLMMAGGAAVAARMAAGMEGAPGLGAIAGLAGGVLVAVLAGRKGWYDRLVRPVVVERSG